MSSSETVVYDDFPVIQPPELPDTPKEADDDCFIEATEEDKGEISEVLEVKEEEAEEPTAEEVTLNESSEMDTDSKTPEDEKSESEKKLPIRAAKRTPTKAKNIKPPVRRLAKRKKLLLKKAKKAAVNKSPKTPIIKKEPDTDGEIEEPEMPSGWTRKVVQRQSGVSAGKYDVYIYSPDSKRFRSKTELSRYLDKTSSPLFIQQFDFTVKKVGGNESETPKQKASQVKTSKKQHPGVKKNKVTPKSVSNVIKREADKSKPNKKLVVKLSFPTSGRRPIRRPARYLNFPDLSIVKKEKVSEEESDLVSPKRPRGRPPLPKKAKQASPSSKKTNTQTPAKSNSKIPPIYEETGPAGSPMKEESEELSSAPPEIPSSVEQPQKEDVASTEPSMKQSRKRPGRPRLSTSAKRGRKPKLKSPEVEPPSPPLEEPVIVDECKETTTAESQPEEATKTGAATEEPVEVDTNGIVETKSSEVVAEVPPPADDAIVVETQPEEKEEPPVKSTLPEWDALPSESLKTNSANSDLYSIVKNVCVRALWKVK